MDDSNELIVEGLEPTDFFTLEKILETYPTTLKGEVTTMEVALLWRKINKITAALTAESSDG